MKKKFGFTLAEVLITLVIIGVIGALTVPSLIQRTNKQEYVSALKKAYSTLSNATQQIIAEEGSPKSSCADCEDGWAHSSENAYNLYKLHLNIVKDCGLEDNDCFTEHPKKIDGSFWADRKYWHESAYRFILSDGMQIMIGKEYSAACNKTWDEGNSMCGIIFVDLNGKKEPNTAGRDIFQFTIKENGLFPHGCDTNSKYCLTAGYDCACRVLREGAMNY